MSGRKSLELKESKIDGKVLWDALNNEKEVDRLLKLGVNPNYISTDILWKGWTPLAYAIHKKNKRLVRALLDNGASPEQLFPNTKHSLVYYALQNKCWGIGDNLICQGAVIPKKIEEELTLIWLFKNEANQSDNDFQILIRELFEKEENINLIIKDADKFDSLLVWLLKKGLAYHACLIMERSAAINHLTEDFIVDVLMRGEWRPAKLLIEKGVPIPKEILGNAIIPFILTFQDGNEPDSYRGRLGLVLTLLSRGFSFNQKIKTLYSVSDSLSLLSWSTFYGSPQFVKELVQYKASPDEKIDIDFFEHEEGMFKPADFLVLEEYVKLRDKIETLLEWQLIKMYVSSGDPTIIHVLCKSSGVPVITYFLCEHSAYRQIALECFNSIIKLDEEKFQENFNKLIQARKEFTTVQEQKSEEKYTIIGKDAGSERDASPARVSYLSSHELKSIPHIALFDAVHECDLNALEKHKKRGADLTRARDTESNSLLHCAAENNANKNILGFLFQSGFDINATNSNHETALFKAVQKNNLRVVEFLVDHGADKAKKYKNETIYSYVLRENKSLEIFRKLIESAGSIEQPLDGEMLSPLSLAAQHDRVDVIHYLVKYRGAKVNVADEKTPLHHAVIAGKDLAVVALLEEGAIVDDNVVKQAEKSSTRSLLTNNVRMKAELKNKAIGLTDIIFLALLSDSMQIPETLSAEQKYFKSLISTVLESFSALNDFFNRVSLETLKSNESKYTRHEKLFINKIKISLIPKDQKPSVGKWLKALQKDEKKSDQFKNSLKSLMVDFTESASDKIWLENIANKIINNLDMSKSKIRQEDLSNWIKNILVREESIRLIFTKTMESKYKEYFISVESEDKMIKLVCDEINCTLQEEGDIKGNQKAFYQTRIQAGLDLWLYEEKCVKDRRLKAYEIALTITNKLKAHSEIKSNLKTGLKSKKFGLCCTLIKEALALLSEEVWDAITSNKVFEENFISNIFHMLISQRIIPGVVFDTKVDRFKHFSTDGKSLLLFKLDLSQGIQRWLFEQDYNECSVSVGKSQYAISPTDKKNDKAMMLEVNKNIFIDRFETIFDQAFGKFSSLDKHLVTRNKTLIDEIKSSASSLPLPSFNMFGADISCNAFVQGLATVGVIIKDWQVAKSAETMTKLFDSHLPSTRTSILREAAEFIANRYVSQLDQLDPEGVRDLAICAANRAIQYVTDPQNISKNAPGLLSKCMALFYPKSPSKKEEYIGPFRAIIAGVMYGKCEDTDKKALKVRDAKTHNEPWIADALFENTGIVVKDQFERDHYYSNTHVVPYYGFCRSTEEEVRERGYKLIPQPLTASSKVEEFRLMSLSC